MYKLKQSWDAILSLIRKQDSCLLFLVHITHNAAFGKQYEIHNKSNKAVPSNSILGIHALKIPHKT